MDAVVRTCRPPPAAGEEPRDARVARKLLRSVGLREDSYDAGVVHRFVELTHRYAGGVVGEARAYADHAGRASLEADDLHLAIRAKAAISPGPPGREAIFDLIRSRNSAPLPKSTAPAGSIPLPPLQDIMLSQNYLFVRPIDPPPDQVEETEDGGEGSNPKQEHNGR
ncbi:transcription initiation factor TFIID subunit 9-like [Phragmites australis]|uniref:transcription initiation factor TFIID subunit 9-like n=1 Tax=Phragmites australis TaxID=29695 RepID=UPI002D785603|nr:transcription initiation factor TFIID subunit 9-like [Phragmites australis]